MFDFLKSAVAEIVSENFQQNIDVNSIQINATPVDFTGDCTIVVFPFTRFSKLNPEATGNFFGEKLKAKNAHIESYNVVKGFLNIVFKNDFWLAEFLTAKNNTTFGQSASTNRKVMVEYSSPNTNKPLHLGHIRNILLGHSISEILKACGNEVIKTTLVNDRGIHICKSMLAWQKFGNGETPASSGLKGDHLVGKYYVEFDKAYKAELNLAKEEAQKTFEKYKQIKQAPKLTILKEQPKPVSNTQNLILESFLVGVGAAMISKLLFGKKIDFSDSLLIGLGSGLAYGTIKTDLHNKEYNAVRAIEPDFEILEPQFLEFKNDLIKHFKNYSLESNEQKLWEQLYEYYKMKSPLMQETQQMLLDWEAGKPEVMHLWAMMNGWVYEGFDASYKMLGVTFDKTYYESKTYLLGKSAVAEGLQHGVFVQDADNSVWIDLTNDGLDRKVLQRKDGTSVYITQDIGTAQLKYDDYKMDESIYVVGNEQDYHFKVLQLILKKLGKIYADGIYHLSYGMVELPSGKMKSREGTVVDADDLMDEMIASAKSTTEELGKLEGLNDAEKEKLFYTVGMGALKYFLLKVDPKKKMLFNPAESIDFHGHTGPFIQYTHARICSILRKNILVRQPLVDCVSNYAMNDFEKKLVQQILQFPTKILEAGKEHNPAHLANYTYVLAKEFTSFYAEQSVLKAATEAEIQFRLHLVEMVATVIKKAMHLLGIEVPEKM